MNRRTLSGAMGATVLACLIAACSNDTSGPKSLISPDVEKNDIAVTSGDGVAEDVELVFAQGTSVDPAFGAAAVGFDGGWGFGKNNCALASGRFTCTSDQNSTRTITRSFAFFDASGATQSAFDPKTTASINFRSEVVGHVQGDSFSTDVDRKRDITESGLLGTDHRREWNGTGSSTASSSHTNGVARSYTIKDATTFSHIVTAVPRKDNPWPLSGTLVRAVDATRTREGTTPVSKHSAYTATITFNGTSIVPLDVGDKHFELNLATHKVKPKA